MLEIAYNFRISLDLFELVTFGTNYGLQMVDKAITGCTKVALRYFGPFPAKRGLEMSATLVFFSENLSQKSNGLRFGDFGRHCVLEMKECPF